MDAPLNMYPMFVTELTSHAEIFALTSALDRNRLDISVTCDTSHSAISKHFPATPQSTFGLEQHATPVGSPLVAFRQLSTAVFSAALSANGSGFVHFLISSPVTVSRSSSVSLESKMSTSPMYCSV